MCLSSSSSTEPLPPVRVLSVIRLEEEEEKSFYIPVSLSLYGYVPLYSSSLFSWN